MRKLFADEAAGGNYYVFGSKVILLRVNSEGIFVVRVNKAKEEYPLSTFLSTSIPQEYDEIIQALKGPKRALVDRDDPVSALADEVESLFRRELKFGFKRRD